MIMGTELTHADRVKAGSQLTQLLRASLREVIDIAPNGEQITRAEHRRNILNKMADGWIEEVRDDQGNLRKIVHPPDKWALQVLMDRTDGKVNLAAPDETRSIKAADKVRDLAKQRLNGMVKTPGAKAGPPKFRKA